MEHKHMSEHSAGGGIPLNGVRFSSRSSSSSSSHALARMIMMMTMRIKS
jgi:hypothetical protein